MLWGNTLYNISGTFVGWLAFMHGIRRGEGLAPWTNSHLHTRNSAIVQSLTLIRLRSDRNAPFAYSPREVESPSKASLIEGDSNPRTKLPVNNERPDSPRIDQKEHSASFSQSHRPSRRLGTRQQHALRLCGIVGIDVSPSSMLPTGLVNIISRTAGAAKETGKSKIVNHGVSSRLELIYP